MMDHENDDDDDTVDDDDDYDYDDDDADDCYCYFDGAQKISKTGGVDRMTDTKNYTGAHKERFDESGKGKGIQGRENVASNTGYVGAYKGEGSFEKK